MFRGMVGPVHGMVGPVRGMIGVYGCDSRYGRTCLWYGKGCIGVVHGMV